MIKRAKLTKATKNKAMHDPVVKNKKKTIQISIASFVCSIIGLLIAAVALSYAILYTQYNQKIQKYEVQLKNYTNKDVINNSVKQEIIPWDKPKKVNSEIQIQLLPYERMPKLYKYFFSVMQNEGDRKKRISKSIGDFRIFKASMTLKHKRSSFNWAVKTQIGPEGKTTYEIFGEAFLMSKSGSKILYELLPAKQKKKSISFEIKESNPGDTLFAILRLEKITGDIFALEKSIDWYIE